MSLNKQQQEAVNSNSKRLLCLAGAGTGKTHCMLSRISRLVNDGADPSSILALTFTNAAAFEMKQRYTASNPGQRIPEFRTFHSFCYSILLKNQNVRKALGYSAIPKVCTAEDVKRITAQAIQSMSITLSKAKLTGKKTLTPQEEAQYKLYKKQFKRLLRKENLITFGIMCYDICRLFVQDQPYLAEYKDRFKYIFVDEFQDTDTEQFDFIQCFPDASVTVVGDALQCQPAGTLVTMSDMTVKRIEDLNIGDYLLTYVPREGRYVRNLRYTSGNVNRYTKRVVGISTHYATNIVKLSTEHFSSCYTKDHITYAKIHHEGNEKAHVTYLMSNNRGWYRVGSTKLFLSSQGSAFGPRLRLQSEKGDRVWILGVYQSAQEAWLNEQLVAYKFRIPQVTWDHTNLKFGINELEQLYENLGDLSEKAITCLSAYGRDMKYPLFTKDDLFLHFSKLHMFECRVGNLIPGIFDLVYVDQRYTRSMGNTLFNNYEVLQSVEPVENQIVYGLEVEGNHNYVGDGLLTHNCIYSFRGADSSIIMDCAENGQWDVVKLYENYRSNSTICKFANENSTYARDSYRIAIHGQREGDPDSVQVFRVDKVGYGKELSSDTIELLNSFPWDTVKGTLAILARSNSEVDALQAYLTDLGVPFVSGRKKLDNVYILRSVIDSEFMVDWLTTYLNADDYSNYIRYLAIEADENPINVLLNHFGRHPKISFFLRKISTIRKIFQTDLPKMTKLYNVLKVLDVKDVMIEEEPENAREAIDYLIRLIDGDPESNIYVGTIHSSKGLEYDTVILVGVDSYHFPLNTEENKNLYYVGITRAKEKLYVFKQRYR